MIEIKHRSNGTVLYQSETATTVGEAVEEAVRKGVSLSYANLSCANLSCANLYHADLSHADLSNANLSCATLFRANLSGIDPATLLRALCPWAKF